MSLTLIKLLALSAPAAALPQAPAGSSTDPFAPNGAVGGILQKVGNVYVSFPMLFFTLLILFDRTLGPSPKGCSKYELVVGQSACLYKSQTSA